MQGSRPPPGTDAMELLATAPTWQVCLAVFLLRIVDVSVGTIRTIAVVRGRPTVAVVLGFFEVLVWLLAIAQVLTRVMDDPVVALFYAGGYAAGNGVGILIERQVSSRLAVLRLLSTQRGQQIASALGDAGRVLAIMPGTTLEGPTHLVYVSARNRNVQRVIERARAVDPDLFFLVEPASEWSANLATLHQPTGWRAVFKRK
jgi:uncharacterized protein YebE (UPF0316 family)